MDSFKNGLVGRGRTPAEREDLLARFHQSQMTQRDFASRHGLALSTLGKWLRGEGQRPLPPVHFQEVVLPHTLARCAVEVVSPQGWIVRLANSSDVESLPQLLQALPC